MPPSSQLFSATSMQQQSATVPVADYPKKRAKMKTFNYNLIKTEELSAWCCVCELPRVDAWGGEKIFRLGSVYWLQNVVLIATLAGKKEIHSNYFHSQG